MRNITIILSLLVIGGCFSTPKKKIGLEGKPMPSFNLLMLDSSTQINTKDLQYNRPLVVLFISPDCPYCKLQTEQIVKKISSFSNIQLLFISSFPLDALKNYYNQYKLNKYPNIMVGQDYNSYFESFYNVNAIPFIAIYGKDKLLKQVLVGNVSSNLIKDIATQ